MLHRFNKFLMIAGALCAVTLPAHAAFDGNGTFNRLYNWQTDKANGINIRADRMDAEMDGFATGLSLCYTRDGQSAPTANLPLNGYRFLSAGPAVSSDEYGTAAQVRDNLLCIGTSSGSVNAYALTRGVAGTSLVTGSVVWFNPKLTNTASATLNVDALGAKPIYKGAGTVVEAGELVSGSAYPLMYDGSAWQMVGGKPTAISQTWQFPSLFSVTGASPVTATSQVSVTLLPQPSNTILAGPSTGNSATPAFRALVNADLPSTITQRVSTSTISVTTISATNLTGSGPGMAKAWAKLEGNGSCTVTRGFNIASCTRITGGTYGVSFSTPSPVSNGNYAVTGTARGGTTNPVMFIFSGQTNSEGASPTTAGFVFKLNAVQTTYNGQDSGDIQLVVFGD